MNRATNFRFLAQPTDVNFGGKVHGGSVMKWIDQAAYACAAGWSGCYCVTVQVGAIHFFKPILVGQIVEVLTRVVHTGRTSMHILAEVFAGDPRDPQRVKATQCLIVFVAVDDAQQPVPVPAWQPTTPQDVALDQYAVRLMELTKNAEREAGVFLELPA